jgi:BD-FAE
MSRSTRFAFFLISVAAAVSSREAQAGLIASNLPYGTLHPDQIFDWYGPDVAVTGPTPIAVFLHGAQGTNGSKNDVNLGTNLVIKNHLLRNGFTVMAIEYRPYPQFIYPTQIEDAALAVQHFKSHDTTYSIDASRLIVWGLSGGAIIGGKLAYGIDYANPNGTAEQQISTRPIAFINLSGLSNFQLMVPWWPGSFFGKDFLYQVSPALLSEASFSQNVLNVPRLFTPPVASCYGTNENPPPVTDPHDVTMMKDFHAHLQQGFPAIAAQSLQLEKSTGAAAEPLEYVAEWTMHKASVFSALDLGMAKPGTNGVAPKLEILGQFDPGTSYTATLHSSVAAPTLFVVVFGTDKANLALAGGTLVPLIAGVANLQSDATGTLSISGTLPADVPLGALTYLQFVQADLGASFGVAFSNAVRVTTGL